MFEEQSEAKVKQLIGIFVLKIWILKMNYSDYSFLITDNIMILLRLEPNNLYGSPAQQLRKIVWAIYFLTVDFVVKDFMEQ